MIPMANNQRDTAERRIQGIKLEIRAHITRANALLKQWESLLAESLNLQVLGQNERCDAVPPQPRAWS
jgi:hypothetical protein